MRIGSPQAIAEWEATMEGDRPPAGESPEEPLGASQPLAGRPPPPAFPWGPPPGTTAPVQWGVAEEPVLPPPPGTVYAGVGIRFLAWLLDLVPLAIIAAVAFGPVFGDFMTRVIEAFPDRPTPGQASSPELMNAMSEAIALATPGFLRASTILSIGALAYLGGSWLLMSRSPAMALFGLRIVREEDGGRLDPARVAVRFGGYYLSSVFLLVGLIWALFDARKQGWHDKLAGTVVVRPASAVQPAPATPPSWGMPAASNPPGWTPPVGWAPPPTEAPAPGGDPLAAAPGGDPAAPVAWPARARRPSAGGVVEAAWQTFRRAPGDLFAALAIVIVPAMIVLLPLIALLLVAQQDQVVLTFDILDDMFRVAGDPGSLEEYEEFNRRIISSSAPTAMVGIVLAVVASIGSPLLIGAAAAAVEEGGAIRSASAVTRILVDRLPALLALGLGLALLYAPLGLVFAWPVLSATSATGSAFDSNRYALATLVGAVVLLPIAIYLGAVWLLAITSVVRERIGPVAGLQRAWDLSRRRMRWLVAISMGVGLAISTVLAPVGTLPMGLLAEDYVGGGRLATALSVISVGIVGVLASPVFGLVYVEAYRAARDDAARSGGRGSGQPS
jgi:uncharacterized RDD family membrane protein YckC